MTTGTNGKHVPPVEAVLFDLDDTLVAYEQDAADVLAAAFDRVGIEPFCSYADLEAVAATVPDDQERDHADYWTTVFERAAERHGGDPAEARDLYEAYGSVLDRTRVTFRPGAEAALRAARDHGPVGIVTNGTRAIQEPKLSNLGLEDAFVTVVCADDVADPKPAPEPFDAALAHLDVPPERALYVGNSLRYDVAGARAAGLRAVWCPVDGDAEPENAPSCLRVDSLHDLPPMLRSSDGVTVEGEEQ